MHAWMRLQGAFTSCALYSHFFYIYISYTDIKIWDLTFKWWIIFVVACIRKCKLIVSLKQLLLLTYLSLFFFRFWRFLFSWRFPNSQSRCGRGYLSGACTHVVGFRAHTRFRKQYCIILCIQDNKKWYKISIWEKAWGFFQASNWIRYFPGLWRWI